MTVDEVRERLAAIEQIAAKGHAGDQEDAHIAEDDLYLAVLRAIADGADNARALAAEAIKASDIEFERWYA